MRLLTGKHQLFFLAVVFLLTVSGCSNKTPKVTTGDSDALGPAESLETQVSEDDNIMEGRTSGPMRPVYFDFDSALIQGDQVERIEANGDFLKADEGVSIRIEGNCDSRGTREYNLALGERRAMNAKKYLVNLGVDPGRLTTVSFGEEKLLLFGHDELSWAQNRRDDFVIIK
ncbi:MAG: peptidoglycan-associated lipoprotein [Desulfobulbus sp.]|nr:MAG: peptidoglycan-associated lipoprotein [Desulfobulbus sp.]